MWFTRARSESIPSLPLLCSPSPQFSPSSTLPCALLHLTSLSLSPFNLPLFNFPPLSHSLSLFLCPVKGRTVTGILTRPLSSAQTGSHSTHTHAYTHTAVVNSQTLFTNMADVLQFRLGRAKISFHQCQLCLEAKFLSAAALCDHLFCVTTCCCFWLRLVCVYYPYKMSICFSTVSQLCLILLQFLQTRLSAVMLAPPWGSKLYH